jgi:hypothetical protein
LTFAEFEVGQGGLGGEESAAYCGRGRHCYDEGVVVVIEFSWEDVVGEDVGEESGVCHLFGRERGW